MSSKPGWFPWIVAGVLAVVPAFAEAQQPVKLSVFLTTFLADANVKTRGLPWTTGAGLPVKWQSPKPVAAAAYLKQQGFTLSRTGTIRVTVEEAQLDATVEVVGNDAGIQQVSIGWNQLSGPFDAAPRSLGTDGIVLEALKCKRETEGASYGNLVHVVKAPGKTASALWESWNCAHDGCGYGIAILYRKSAVAAIECASGG